MRLGIFGGTFDPVHYCHLILAECCREQLALDKVWFLPTAVPPHKQQQELTPGEQRAEMLDLALGGDPAMAVCRYEISRGGVNYTVETLENHFVRESPGAELFFLMGADSLRDLPNWRNPQRLCELATPVAVNRGGDGEQGSDPTTSPEWAALAQALPPARLQAIRSTRVEMPRIDISSSELRSLVAAGRSIRYRTPRAIEKYIETHGLYVAGR
ncbi:MAG: nicotinate-nucleotide adenylyltransferase [Pirellulales bacterium]